MGARVTLCAATFQLTVGAGVAIHAAVFQLPMGAGGAHRTAVCSFALGAGLAHHTVVFQLAVVAGLAVRAVVLHLAVRARTELCTQNLRLPVQAPLMCSSHHSRSTVSSPTSRAHRSARRKATTRKKEVVAFSRAALELTFELNLESTRRIISPTKLQTAYSLYNHHPPSPVTRWGRRACEARLGSDTATRCHPRSANDRYMHDDSI